MRHRLLGLLIAGVTLGGACGPLSSLAGRAAHASPDEGTPREKRHGLVAEG